MDYHVPTVDGVQAVRWQSWFWRSWGRLILTAIVTNLVALMLKNLLGWFWLSIWLGAPLPKRGFWQVLASRMYDSYASAGFIMGLFFGFWISAFTCLLLRKNQPKRHQLFWFVIHYMLGAIAVIIGFWLIIRFNNPTFITFRLHHIVELPFSSFIVASGLVGWQMQRWRKRVES